MSYLNPRIQLVLDRAIEKGAESNGLVIRFFRLMDASFDLKMAVDQVIERKQVNPQLVDAAANILVELSTVKSGD